MRPSKLRTNNGDHSSERIHRLRPADPSRAIWHARCSCGWFAYGFVASETAQQVASDHIFDHTAKKEGWEVDIWQEKTSRRIGGSQGLGREDETPP
jgi:hypothetical protein